MNMLLADTSIAVGVEQQGLAHVDCMVD